jgi:hypothetical protein
MVPPVRRPVYQTPPVVVRPVKVFPVPERAPRESALPGMGGPLVEVEDRMKTFEEQAALPTRLRPVVTAPERKVAIVKTDVRKLMRSPETLRAAILVREILGPPPGL